MNRAKGRVAVMAKAMNSTPHRINSCSLTRSCEANYGLRLNVYRNKPSLENVGRPSSSISSTRNFFLAFFMN
jgi:hypothetical protein